MLRKNDVDNILEELEKMFPNAGCELNYNNLYELIVAVVLSAQTTDKSVNKVTPALFLKYPTPADLANANKDDVKKIIAPIGLSENKSKNIIGLAQKLVSDFNSVVPKELDQLVTLPGVGRKTANVVMSEGYHIPAIAVDTHVERVSKRLGICPFEYNVLQVERTLQQFIDKSMWHHAHHLLLFFGRYFCKAKNPNCDECFYKDKCKK